MVIGEEFLIKYPLYRRYKIDPPLSGDLDRRIEQIEFSSIKSYCKECKDEHTFVFRSGQDENLQECNHRVNGRVFIRYFECARCGKYRLRFAILLAHDLDSIMKIGQFPSWKEPISNDLRKSLGEFVDNYEKGLACESQSYGIGAYAYYRRMVEDLIQKLLDDIAKLVEGDEDSDFAEKVEAAKHSRRADEKIEIVKESLPVILRPGGVNPLSIIHSTLSEGLHSKSDEECLLLALQVRESLTFLVEEVHRTKSRGYSYKANMNKLLDDKSKQDEPKG